jgi:hypothetical protein
LLKAEAFVAIRFGGAIRHRQIPAFRAGYFVS